VWHTPCYTSSRNTTSARGVSKVLKVQAVFRSQSENEIQKERKVPLRMTTFEHRVSPQVLTGIGEADMTESFTASAPGALAKGATVRRRVLVTGAAGNIGAYFAEHSHQNYDLRLMVHQLDDRAAALRAYGEVVAG